MQGYSAALPQVAADSLNSAKALHRHLTTAFWNGAGLIGPDAGVRLNYRVGRFVKSYASYITAISWDDAYYYLQAQGYWILANWRLFRETRDQCYHDIAVACSMEILNRQRANGAWDYPNLEWKGRIATVEGIWAALGLLATYRHTRDERFLAGALRWNNFLVNDIGFIRIKDELAIKYFANRPTARVPNNSANALRFFGELSQATADRAFLEPCSGMATFLMRAQKPTGEFPYSVAGPTQGLKCRKHFQCYQYNAFESIELMRYWSMTSDERVRQMSRRCVAYLATGLADDGHAYYDCSKRSRRVWYHTAALGAAFAEATESGLGDYQEARQRAFACLFRMQRADGSFPFSTCDYRILSDRRCYPRQESMMLYHFLLNWDPSEPGIDRHA